MSLTAFLLALGVVWHAVRPGVWQAESRWATRGPLSGVRVILVRMDPRQLQFQLDTATRDYSLRAAWMIDSIPAKGVVAFNAGQFTGGFPWGWLVVNGVEVQPPGKGTLGMAFVVDSSGTPSLVPPDQIPAARAYARLAFQSYPTILSDSMPPWELRDHGRGVDLKHRDSRLALCRLGDGSLLVALTRFGGAGRAGETLPWGPTVPEMASYMQSLGCRDAMLLDGGISSQLAVRGANGELSRWANWRYVPLALVAFPRTTPNR